MADEFKVRHRAGTAAQWADPEDGPLLLGEIGVLLDDDGTPLEAKVGDGATAFADLPLDLGGAPAPIVTRRTSDLSLPATQNTWVDAETVGSATARPLDIVIPGVRAGQWIEVSASLTSASAAPAVLLDMWTVVAGAAVNRFGGAGTNTSWLMQANQFSLDVGSPRSYQIQEADIEDGAVRCRLRSYNVTGTARTVLGSLGYYEIRLEGRGPFG